MSHTPGPWTVEGVEVLGPSGESVVWELGNNASHNASLIAAAPDLLAACGAAIAYDAAIHRRGLMGDVQAVDSAGQRAHVATGDDLDALYDAWIAAVRTAMAKAEGR